MGKSIRRNISLDQEIAQSYAKFLIESGAPDSPEARHDFCDLNGTHPKLLYYNPHIRSLESLFSDRSNVERLMDMDRKEKVLSRIEKDGRGLEIGASFAPFAPKRDGYQTHGPRPRRMGTLRRGSSR